MDAAPAGTMWSKGEKSGRWDPRNISSPQAGLWEASDTVGGPPIPAHSALSPASPCSLLPEGLP